MSDYSAQHAASLRAQLATMREREQAAWIAGRDAAAAVGDYWDENWRVDSKQKRFSIDDVNDFMCGAAREIAKDIRALQPPTTPDGGRDDGE